MSKHSIEMLRVDWPLDIVESEIIPLIQSLELHKQYPEIALKLMNFSTAEGISILKNASSKPLQLFFGGI